VLFLCATLIAAEPYLLNGKENITREARSLFERESAELYKVSTLSWYVGECEIIRRWPV